MVRRLVEDEEVRTGRDDDREGQPPTLPAREHGHGFDCSSQPEKRKRPSRFCAD